MIRVVYLVFCALILAADFYMSKSGQPAKWSSVLLADSVICLYILGEVLADGFRTMKESEK